VNHSRPGTGSQERVVRRFKQEPTDRLAWLERVVEELGAATGTALAALPPARPGEDAWLIEIRQSLRFSVALIFQGRT